MKIAGGGYAQTPFNTGNGVLVRDNSGTTPTLQAVGLLMTGVKLDLSNAALTSSATTIVADTYTGDIVINLTPGA